MNIIETRRSIRKFQDKPVGKEIIEEIIKEASFAPSWKNCQPVRYIAVQNREVLQKIADTCVLGFVPNGKIIARCPILIIETIVHGRSGFERDGSFTTSKGDRWEVFDAGIAAQTLCLAATEHGLGSVIMGIFDETKLAETASIPEGQIAAAMIAMGYPAEDPHMPKRKAAGDLLSWR